MIDASLMTLHGQYLNLKLAGINDVIDSAVSVDVTTMGIIPSGNKAVADVKQTDTRNVIWPPLTQPFTWDDDGNLTSDGVWNYQWDAENRLTQMSHVTSLAPSVRLRLNFEYDWQGRRIRKTVTRLSDNTVTLDHIYLYDGWNLIAVLNSSLSIQQSFMWGLDLSGSMQGAGGVGGLLRITQHTSPVTAYFPAYDGNGNVMALVNAENSQDCARYEYGPFGEVIRATGPMAKVNPFRWSTQYTDDETDLVMYPGRPYNPSTGRFLTRDPIGEKGGLNPYVFVLNDPIDYLDPDGRDTWVPYPPPGHYVSDPKPPPPPPDPVGFALCMRNVNPEGLGEHLLLIGFRILHPQTPTDHAYLHYKHCDTCERVGLGIGGTKPGAKPIPEHKFQPTDCKPCKRTGSTLQYGATTKTGTQATDEEIWDCISKVPTSKNYKPTGKGHYNCLDWAKEAASKCGLDCN